MATNESQSSGAGFTVVVQYLRDYAARFRESGDDCNDASQQIAQANIPAEAFGANSALGSSAQPQLYATYHGMWQRLMNLTGSGLDTMVSWSSGLETQANAYEMTDLTQATSMNNVPAGP